MTKDKWEERRTLRHKVNKGIDVSAAVATPRDDARLNDWNLL
jgi:hypothetical protein